eukprot:CAMPEP_0116137690 /NCGR_PEP_ID=MMETSP0329-20121206/12377_1 /TAXON_ID=697910 /ORGANISM="Pseudo-nitzschia arenysensis, Strain B593" /LENGTH=219 /DNA_ID=CAMNT_0003632611 /DNA_START=90 /DNA_END=749 /DNA_ORIENTATION=-
MTRRRTILRIESSSSSTKHQSHLVSVVLLLLFFLSGQADGFSPSLTGETLEGSFTATMIRKPLKCERNLATSTNTRQSIVSTSTVTTTTTTITTTSTTSLQMVPDWASNTDVWVFGAGIFPFLWATYEFWRRIMFGEAFGTGTDSVIIGMEDSPSDSRGVRVLGRGALITAYTLFIIAFGTLGVVLYSVVTSEVPTEEAFAAATAAANAAAEKVGETGL